MISAPEMSPLSSWSADRAGAELFAKTVQTTRDQPASKNGAVITTTIPVSQILSTPRTGLGALNVQEVVVLGSDGDVVRERVR